jgi:hypothetical protein
MAWVRLNVVVVAMFGLVASCGDDGTAPADGGGSGSGSGESTDGESSGSATESADTSGSDDGAGSGGASEASGAELACTQDGDLLWPLAVGRVWHNELLCSCDCDGMDWSLAITATVEMGGREAFELHEGCGLTDFTSYYAVAGAIVERYETDGTWTPVFEEPIADGQVWSDGMTQWVAVPEITVAAGTFTDCFRVQPPTEGPPSTTYCPGIGPVAVTGFETGQQLTGCEVP